MSAMKGKKHTGPEYDESIQTGAPILLRACPGTLKKFF